MAMVVAYRAVLVAGFIMADKNIIDDMIAQRIVFNELKQNMIEHGVKFGEEVDNNKLKMEAVSNPTELVFRINGVDVGKFEYNNEKAEYAIKYKYFDLIYVYNFDQKKQINEFVKNKLIELNDSWNDKTGMRTMMEQKITIDDDYSVVRRPRTFKVDGKIVGEFKFNSSTALWKFYVEGKKLYGGIPSVYYDPNDLICDELNEEILQAILDELKRLNSTYRGI